MSNDDRAQVAALGAVPLTNDMTLLKVPKRHARRAELAVVLAELAEACGLPDDDEAHWIRPLYTRPNQSQREWPGYVRIVGYAIEGLPSGRVSEDLGDLSGDPLEAARLALAHVRGRG